MQNIRPIPELQKFIDKIWILETSGTVPDISKKLIVPSGKTKLILPFKNGLSNKTITSNHISQENSINLLGPCDLPSFVDAENNTASGTIGIELSYLGAYHFLGINQYELKNHAYPLDELLGKAISPITEQIANTTQPKQKIHLLQRFLANRLTANSDSIFEYCIQHIIATKGYVTIRQLEKKTGYSSRWLNHKFGQYAGISPKTLCTLMRFQHFYQALVNKKKLSATTPALLDSYFDQSHYYKDFKRFTGLAPADFKEGAAEFGKIFYNSR